MRLILFPLVFGLVLALVAFGAAEVLKSNSVFGRHDLATLVGAGIGGLVPALAVLAINRGRPVRLHQGVGVGVLALFIGHFIFAVLSDHGDPDGLGRLIERMIDYLKRGSLVSFPLFVGGGLLFALAVNRRRDAI